MRTINRLANTRGPGRRQLAERFAVAGAMLGLPVGLYEAGLLYLTPRIPSLLRPDTNYLVWFVSPLIAVLLFAVVGYALGIAADIGARRSWPAPLFVALGTGLAGFYVALIASLAEVRVGERFRLQGLLVPSACFGAIFISALMIFWVWQRRSGHFWETGDALRLRRWGKIPVLAASVCVVGLGTDALRHSVPMLSAARALPSSGRAPNIVLIVLDTVRADHISAYGYSRKTTPNLDRLASQGVLFEDALSPSSWTLPALASIFTGLLPHQHGANWSVPLTSAPWTLAEVLASQGYETAAFNANPAYGLAGWGIAQGFQTYVDQSSSLRHNLAATLVGHALIQPFYEELVHYNSLDRRDAREVNGDIMRWFQRQSRQPFFLFVNYFDNHYPYVAPPPFNQRFGIVPDSIIRRAANFEYRGHVPAPTPEHLAALITAYDNCLAYLDDQLGQLLQLLAQSSDWANTIVIVTADHGEAFGEHDSYGHGVDLYREVIQVPLIFFGPGIPAGRRVTGLARTRELFPTVLNLAMGSKLPFSLTTLRRYWTPNFEPSGNDDLALSELMTVVGLATRDWHYLLYATGRSELFHRASDPQEKNNLSENPAYQQTERTLNRRLVRRVGLSLEPWRGPEYLLAVTRPDIPSPSEQIFLRERQSSLRRAEPPAGAAQAFFRPQEEPKLPRPSPAELELMQSLPYQ